MDDTISTTTRLTPAQRRQWGSFYTPTPIVQYMVRSCMKGPLRRSGAILDPACGDGMFLVGVAEHLLTARRSCGEERLDILRRRIFGVDLDPKAVAAARQRLAAWIAPDNQDLAAQTKQVLATNLRVGNSLIGADFQPSPRIPGGFSWRRAFPQVAADGGFQVVLGNPPYCRELAAKELFDSIADTPLGRRWRQPRMDLWYYFLHRGLDLLRPGGTLSFIVNSYWTGSRGAAKLIERLQCETTLDEIVMLGDRKIFADVTGRHLMMRLRKKHSHRRCTIATLDAKTSIFPRSSRDLHPPHRVHRLEQSALYTAGRLILSPPPAHAALYDNCRTLGEAFETAQGIAENPPRINRRLATEFAGRFQVGEGVFVLANDEVESLQFNAEERSLLRPYFETASLDRYTIPFRAPYQLLYLTRDTAPSLEGLPNVRRHLMRFRPVLERRRETQAGQNNWWHLHWPRREHLFEQPAILSLQMGHLPRFVLAAEPAYVGFSVNLISRKVNDEICLAALTGILNSTIAAEWFTWHAKCRGVNLEINLNVLRQFPLPPRDARRERRLAELVAARHQGGAPKRCAQQEARIDEIVAGLYGA